MKPRRLPVSEPMFTGALAVADTEPWWIAVHSIIDQAEWETVEGARNRTHDTNKCIAAVGAGEGVALVRQKLMDARNVALKEINKGG